MGHPAILHTVDGCENWETEAGPTILGGEVKDIFFFDKEKGFAISDPTSLFSTIDGGQPGLIASLCFRKDHHG